VAIDASVNNETRNVRVRSIVDNKNGLLRQGMFVQVSVPVEAPSPRVVIPNTSLRRSSYGDQVFVVVAAEAPGMYRAKQRFVKLGPTVGEDVIVLEGVKAGDELATVGSFKLHDGALVRSVEAAKK
ncbi:MAG: efflux transporter periplasmic adaptor subunit, partial [Planctomycetota bacterium]